MLQCNSYSALVVLPSRFPERALAENTWFCLSTEVQKSKGR